MGWLGEEFTQDIKSPILILTWIGDNDLLVKVPNLNLQGSYGGDGVDTTLSGEYVTGIGGGGEHGTVGGSNTYSVGGGLLYDVMMVQHR